MLFRMSAASPSVLRRGLYTAAEVARIAGITSPRVRRWVEGYPFLARDGSERHSPALVPCERQGDRLYLGFADLVESSSSAASSMPGCRGRGFAWCTPRLARNFGRRTRSR